MSAIHFYEKCLDKRLFENDFSFANDGSSGQKLDILESMMLLKQSITMIGDFTDRGPMLYAEKIAGNVCGCIGCVKDKNTSLNVPNTLLKKDIIVKCDRDICLKECSLNTEIERLLNMGRR